MPEHDMDALRRKVLEMAYGLGIALYLRDDGLIAQMPPAELAPEELARWERIEPPAGAVPLDHGHGRGAEVQAQP